MQNSMHIPLFHPLQCQSRNQCSAHAASILGGQDLDGVVIVGIRLCGPVENLTKGSRTALLEVRVLVEYRPVSADVAFLVALLFADGSNAAG